MKKRRIVLSVFILLAIIISAVLIINAILNNTVFVTEYEFSHPDIPPAFDGCRFMVLSDLHEADFVDRIVEHIQDADPEFLLMVGDMVQLPWSTAEKALSIAEVCDSLGVPVYAVSGNHERQCGRYDELVDEFWAGDIYLLENGSVKVEKDGESILLVGIKDPRHDIVTEQKANVIRGNIEYELSKQEDMFSILLNHRADLYPEIKDTGVDLIVSGHLHGGIIRLPFLGGIIGKKKTGDMLPKYDYGVVKEGDSATMIVNGGCDKNPKKKRFLNPPEVLLITLKGE